MKSSGKATHSRGGGGRGIKDVRTTEKTKATILTTREKEKVDPTKERVRNTHMNGNASGITTEDGSSRSSNRPYVLAHIWFVTAGSTRAEKEGLVAGHSDSFKLNDLGKYTGGSSSNSSSSSMLGDKRSNR